jgi:hypothetical protein
MASREAAPVVVVNGHDLGLRDAVVAVRTGAHVGHRIWRLGFRSPAITAALLWIATRYLQTVGRAWHPFPTPVLAWWTMTGAYLLTLYAIVALGIAVISPTPTHRAVNGRWQPIRRDPWRSTGPGYARIKAAKEHLTREQRRAQRDIDRATRTLGRWGAKRRRAWERQWAAEDQVGATRSTPGAVDMFLMQRAPKPKAKAGKPKGPKGKKAREQADAEFKAELARINDERAATGRPLLDPNGGPKPAPTRPRSVPVEDPMVAEWRRHAAAVEARTRSAVQQIEADQHRRNGWRGYEPPPAPISVTEDDA